MSEFALDGGVELRLPEEADAGPMYALIESDRDRLAMWLPWAREQTFDDTLEFIRAVRRQHAAGDGIQTVITVDGTIAGMVGVHAISWLHEQASIGYWLGTQFEGRGIMTAAVRAYTEHAFTGWGLNRMELRAAVENARSRAIAQRLGFVEEGVLREAEKVSGRRLDLVVYSMLAADWRG